LSTCVTLFLGHEKIMQEYEVIKKVGSGSFGEIWKCAHKQTRREVAVKVFRNADPTGEVIHQAVREARILSWLHQSRKTDASNRRSHNNSLDTKVCDANDGEDDALRQYIIGFVEAYRSLSGNIYIVMEYAPYGLWRVLREYRKRYGTGLAQEDAVKLMYQLLRVLRALHHSGVVHRDIKPENLLLTAEGDLKLCDFGWARRLPHRGARTSTGSSPPPSMISSPPGQPMPGSQAATGAAAAGAAGAAASKVPHSKTGNFERHSYHGTGHADDTGDSMDGLSNGSGMLHDAQALEKDGHQVSPSDTDTGWAADVQAGGEAGETPGSREGAAHHSLAQQPPGASKGEMTPYAVTRWYRAPEVLVGDPHYGAAVDVWAAGCVFAEMVTGYPLLPGNSHVDQIALTMRVLGLPLPPRLLALLCRCKWLDADDKMEIVPLARDVKQDPGPVLAERLAGKMSPAMLEVLDACLQMDPLKRPTADQLLAMPLFSPLEAERIRTKQLQQLQQQQQLAARPGTGGLGLSPRPTSGSATPAAVGASRSAAEIGVYRNSSMPALHSQAAAPVLVPSAPSLPRTQPERPTHYATAPTQVMHGALSGSLTLSAERSFESQPEQRAKRVSAPSLNANASTPGALYIAAAAAARQYAQSQPQISVHATSGSSSMRRRAASSPSGGMPMDPAAVGAAGAAAPAWAGSTGMEAGTSASSAQWNQQPSGPSSWSAAQLAGLRDSQQAAQGRQLLPTAAGLPAESSAGSVGAAAGSSRDAARVVPGAAYRPPAAVSAAVAAAASSAAATVRSSLPYLMPKKLAAAAASTMQVSRGTARVAPEAPTPSLGGWMVGGTPLPESQLLLQQEHATRQGAALGSALAASAAGRLGTSGTPLHPSQLLMAPGTIPAGSQAHSGTLPAWMITPSSGHIPLTTSTTSQAGASSNSALQPHPPGAPTHPRRVPHRAITNPNMYAPLVAVPQVHAELSNSSLPQLHLQLSPSLPVPTTLPNQPLPDKPAAAAAAAATAPVTAAFAGSVPGDAGLGVVPTTVIINAVSGPLLSISEAAREAPGGHGRRGSGDSTGSTGRGSGGALLVTDELDQDEEPMSALVMRSLSDCGAIAAAEVAGGAGADAEAAPGGTTGSTVKPTGQAVQAVVGAVAADPVGIVAAKGGAAGPAAAALTTSISSKEGAGRVGAGAPVPSALCCTGWRLGGSGRK